jgi:hypothetical protein
VSPFFTFPGPCDRISFLHIFLAHNLLVLSLLLSDKGAKPMMTRLFATVALVASASAAAADTGATIDGTSLAGLALLGISAIGILQFALHERRRERNSPGPLKLRVKARRYNQP